MVQNPHQAFVGVGANLGDRWAAICDAISALSRASGVLAVATSPVYETAPVGLTDQPFFFNLVLGLETTLTPAALLTLLRSLEQAAGRQREIRWGPRTLDLDLLLYEGVTCDTPDLTLPHPRIWERPFVIVPLRDLFTTAPRFQRPVWNDIRNRLAVVAGGPGISPWQPPSK